MKENKKIIIGIFIGVVIIVSVLLGIYRFKSKNFYSEEKFPNATEELKNHIRNAETDESRREQINTALGYNLITQEEANELY